MINPIAARIAFNTTSSKATTPVVFAVIRSNSDSDSFISSTNFGNNTSAEVKSSKSFLEILFGNVSKKQNKVAKEYNRYEAALYAKPKNKTELDEFIKNYDPMLKW